MKNYVAGLYALCLLLMLATVAIVKANAEGVFIGEQPSTKPQAFFIFELAPKLFLNEGKAISILDEGHSIILIKTYDSEANRPRLAAAKQTPTGVEEIEAGWFQPSLIFLMDSERILIRKTSRNQIAVQGISLDTLVWMSRN
jgi:hypothetical protein